MEMAVARAAVMVAAVMEEAMVEVATAAAEMAADTEVAKVAVATAAVSRGLAVGVGSAQGWVVEAAAAAVKVKEVEGTEAAATVTDSQVTAAVVEMALEMAEASPRKVNALDGAS